MKHISEQEKLFLIQKMMLICSEYARFISEADTAGAFTPEIIEVMSKEMDLSIEDVKNTIGNATKSFDLIKETLGETE